MSVDGRSVVFISKATPGDDEFVLWLAPRLEAEGYEVFADILRLEPGTRWRRDITETLQKRAVKMLLCCRDSTLDATGVQEEISIGTDCAKELSDPKFIIPVRVEPYRKLFGIADLQYIDFTKSWANGLEKLLTALHRQGTPRNLGKRSINPNWELYRRRSAIPLRHEPERLTSNWLRMTEIPGVIRYFEPTGALDIFTMAGACAEYRYPVETLARGFLSFGDADQINRDFEKVSRFAIKAELSISEFLEQGLPDQQIKPRDASNKLQSLFRQGWNRLCRDRGLLEYKYSNALGFHASKGQVKIGAKIPWGKQGEKRSSMLRNEARGYIWQFGVTGMPSLWPYYHFKLKSRVLFAPIEGEEAGDPVSKKETQHRLRRTICKGWRNKQWHGRMLAFLELLSGKSSTIKLPLGENLALKLDAAPVLFTSPVTTALPNVMGEDQEDEDDTTLPAQPNDDNEVE